LRIPTAKTAFNIGNNLLTTARTTSAGFSGGEEAGSGHDLTEGTAAYGTITFNGNGTYSISATGAHVFDKNAENGAASARLGPSGAYSIATNLLGDPLVVR
jgi:hypothetical protein